VWCRYACQACSRSICELIAICLDFSIAPEELYALVEANVASNDIAGWTGLGPVVSALKNSPELRWAAPLDVKNAVDKAFIAKFGPKESAKSKTKVSQWILF
jgi:glutaminyl-tRNA synthetase